MTLHSDIAAALYSLSRADKEELTRLGITAATRSNWKKGQSNPTVAQLQTLAIILDRDPAPWLMWLAREQATPAQLELFLKALAKSTAALALVILAGAENHADAASMRVTELTRESTGTHIMRG